MSQQSQLEEWKRNQTSQISKADLNEVSLLTYLTKTLFGYGAVKGLRDELAALSISRPLFVTDAPLLKSPIGDEIRKMADGHAVYSGTPENPTEASCREAADMYLAENCDAIVAVGGGSPMDLAKAAALLASHPGELATYALANGGLDRITDKCPPVIAVPTTAGTGSEVARTTVIITASGQKLPIGSPYLIPALAICDPALTLSLPPRLTAATAFDTIAHCVESFSSSRINLPAEAIALDGLQRAVCFIEDAVRDGTDREARWHLLMAAMQGGLSFPKGLGAIHALAHPLGETGVHHGTVNGIAKLLT